MPGARRQCSVGALVIAACLAGAGAQAAWVKEGASVEDLKRDRTECERKARADVSFNSSPSRGAGAMSGTRATNTMAREQQAFGLCMKSRGYTDAPGN